MLATVAISFASAQGAPARTSFAGTWVLDSVRSEASSFTPKSATYVVVQGGDSMIVDRETSGGGKQHAVYLLNGQPRTNTLRLIGTETAATSTVTWSGAVMVVHTTSHPSDADLIQTDTWTLSADGRELRMKREAAYAGNPMGSPTLVFTRKP